MLHERNVSLYIAMSVDGYIATPDESLQWLERLAGDGDHGYSRFYETVDTVMMGKKTYDWVMTHVDGPFPYAPKPCYVFTTSNASDTEHVTFVKGDIASFVETFKQRTGQRIWLVGGGQLLRSFLNEGLVDELIVTVAPIVLGDGIPLFPKQTKTTDLLLNRTTTYGPFVELHYDVLHSERSSPDAN
ncbi:dihydrofolate reductase [Planococcaceae bacterium Storch 2/2-2]|nr:dihydrofolate reductase [Planococcaceae bacterium Storch 2/2-2]